MRGIVLVFAVLAAVAPAAPQEPFTAVADAYQEMAARYDPVVAARAQGRAPDGWAAVDRGLVKAKGEEAAALRARLAVSEGGDPVSRAVLDAILEDIETVALLDEARIPFDSDWGFHLEPVFTVSRTSLQTEADAEATILRIEAVPAYFDGNLDNLRRGLAERFTAHGGPLGNIIEQVREQIVDDPADSRFFEPFEDLPERFPNGAPTAPAKDRALAAVSGAIAAYERVLGFLVDAYAPHARPSPGLSSLPGGAAHYQALVVRHTTRPDLTPEAVHALGLAEVARIGAEMDAVIEEAGFDGSRQDFIAFLREDPRFYAKSADALLCEAARLAKTLDAMLPRYFGRLPRLPYGVEPVPAEIAPGYTTARYAPGDPENGVAGTYLVNTHRLDQRPLYELPALTAHEAVPGHHLQIALAQELADVPDFRRRYFSTAYGEGWALYAERIAGEAGLYETPYERFGALSYEMWRACRLVADTGLHWYGWTREQAKRCFEENTALAPLNIETEVTRYIGDPGQALGYKVGELTIRALREEADKALGAEFDVRAFHDLVLAEGATPLNVLEERVAAWIDAQLAAGGERR